MQGVEPEAVEPEGVEPEAVGPEAVDLLFEPAVGPGSAPTALTPIGCHRIQSHTESREERPNTICSRPVAARTGSNARPEASLATIRTGATTSGRASSGRSATTVRGEDSTLDTDDSDQTSHGGEGHQDTGHVEPSRVAIGPS